MAEKETRCAGGQDHPGGKLLRQGPASCTEEELLAIIIGTGIRDKSASQIAEEILDKYLSVNGLMGKPLSELKQIKGLNDVKVARIAAAHEIAIRIVKNFERGW